MSELMSQDQIVEITECKQQAAQERRLADMGYIVLKRSAGNRVRCLAAHPQDPALQAANAEKEQVKLHL